MKECGRERKVDVGKDQSQYLNVLNNQTFVLLWIERKSINACMYLKKTEYQFEISKIPNSYLPFPILTPILHILSVFNSNGLNVRKV